MKLLKNILYLLAYKGSGFDSYVVFKKLPQWRTLVGFIKNRSGIVSLKYSTVVDEKKKNPQYVHFRCGLLHIKDSIKNIGES